MGRIIAIANQKGGVGKTTTAMNLAGSLGVLEHDVLLIDTDPQANSTSGVGYDPKEIKNGIYECLIGKSTADNVILKTTSPNLDVLPANIDLVGAELELVNMKEREYQLRKVLIPIKDKTVIENIIEQFTKYSINDFYLTLNFFQIQKPPLLQQQ